MGRATTQTWENGDCLWVPKRSSPGKSGASPPFPFLPKEPPRRRRLGTVQGFHWAIGSDSLGRPAFLLLFVSSPTGPFGKPQSSLASAQPLGGGFQMDMDMGTAWLHGIRDFIHDDQQQVNLRKNAMLFCRFFCRSLFSPP